MIRQHVTCPCCLVPFVRTIAGDRPLVPGGWYYPPAQANWCQECRLGVRWFPQQESFAMRYQRAYERGYRMWLKTLFVDFGGAATQEPAVSVEGDIRRVGLNTSLGPTELLECGSESSDSLLMNRGESDV